MKLVDGDIRTCIRLQQPEGRAQIQATLLVNDDCKDSANINLNLTVKDQTQCNELLGIILIEKPTATCSKVAKCDEISFVIEEGHRVCGIGVSMCWVSRSVSDSSGQWDQCGNLWNYAKYVKYQRVVRGYRQLRFLCQYNIFPMFFFYGNWIFLVPM